MTTESCSKGSLKHLDGKYCTSSSTATKVRNRRSCDGEDTRNLVALDTGNCCGGNGDAEDFLEKTFSCSSFRTIDEGTVNYNPPDLGNDRGKLYRHPLTRKSHRPMSDCNFESLEIKSQATKTDSTASWIGRVKDFCLHPWKRAQALMWTSPGRSVLYGINDRENPITFLDNKAGNAKGRYGPGFDKNVSAGTADVNRNLCDSFFDIIGDDNLHENAQAPINCNSSHCSLSGSPDIFSTPEKWIYSRGSSSRWPAQRQSVHVMPRKLNAPFLDSNSCACHDYRNHSKAADSAMTAAGYHNRKPSRRFRSHHMEFPYRESSADRLVGLTLHCVILSLAVMAVVLARWASEVLKFVFYLAVHSAVYKGHISPLQEDTSEPVNRQQLRDATVFDFTGLKIILLQYRPPRRPALQCPNDSRLDTADFSTDTAEAATYIKKSTTTTSTTNGHHQVAAPQKSISLHSGSSQDLSHIFSISST